MQGIQLHAKHFFKILKAFVHKNDKETLNLSQLGCRSEFFDEDEHLDSLIDIISTMTNLRNLDMSGISLNENSSLKIIQACARYTKLSKIPDEILLNE